MWENNTGDVQRWFEVGCFTEETGACENSTHDQVELMFLIHAAFCSCMFSKLS